MISIPQIILSITTSSLLFSQFINNETGWSYYQSTNQAVYIFEEIKIDGIAIIGSGADSQEEEDYCHNDPNMGCDVVGAFFNDICIGWVYGDSSGYTSVPAMGFTPEDEFADYPIGGDSITFKIFDSSANTIFSFDLSGDDTTCYTADNSGDDGIVYNETDCFWDNFFIPLIAPIHIQNGTLDNNEIPSDFNLLSAYPNPFNPSININFHIESNSLVDLKIYDMLGGVVDTLILNDFMATGNHSVAWTPNNNVSAGEYIISLSVDGNQKATQKIAYIK